MECHGTSTYLLARWHNMKTDDEIREFVDGQLTDRIKIDFLDFPDVMPSTQAAGKEYPEPEQFISGFLAPGLTVLAATPKAGKTTLAHHLVVSIAAGQNALGVLPCRQAACLCLFLEDNERRVVRRERVLAGHSQGIRGLDYAFSGSKWTTSRLYKFAKSYPTYRVFVIDTVERWRQMQDIKSSGRVYEDEYRFLGELQEFAIKTSVAVILIHHDRKPTGGGGNALDTVSGTRAITGAADNIWLLSRDAELGTSTLKTVGRDFDERSIKFSRGVDGRLRAVAQAVPDTVDRIDRRAKARKMREEGSSVAAIARELGVSKSTIHAWCSDAGSQL